MTESNCVALPLGYALMSRQSVRAIGEREDTGGKNAEEMTVERTGHVAPCRRQTSYG